jgi:hypothetical protein
MAYRYQPTIFRRPLKITARQFFNFLVVFTILSLDPHDRLAHATYVAMYYDNDTIIMASDSRTYIGELAAIDYCKVIPVSRSMIFAAIGMVGVMDQAGGIADDANATAKLAFTESGETPTAERVAQKWAELMVAYLNQDRSRRRDVFIERQLKEGNVVRGIFAASGNSKLGFLTENIKIADTRQTSLTFTVEERRWPVKIDQPFVTFGQKRLIPLSQVARYVV